ncbi:hypothetical protein RDABS01_032719, partial [Bienertia sinuspersici]
MRVGLGAVIKDSNGSVIRSTCSQVKRINSKVTPGSYATIFVKEIVDLANLFDCISFQHVYKEANYLAHALAHFKPINFSIEIWVEGYPLELED